MKKFFLFFSVVFVVFFSGCGSKNISLEKKYLKKYDYNHTLYVPYGRFYFYDNVYQYSKGISFRLDNFKPVNKWKSKSCISSLFYTDRKCNEKICRAKPFGTYEFSLKDTTGVWFWSGFWNFGIVPAMLGFPVSHVCYFDESKFYNKVEKWIRDYNVTNEERKKILDIYNLCLVDIKKLKTRIYEISQKFNIESDYENQSVDNLLSNSFPCKVNKCYSILKNVKQQLELYIKTTDSLINNSVEYSIHISQIYGLLSLTRETIFKMNNKKLSKYDIKEILNKIRKVRDNDYKMYLISIVKEKGLKKLNWDIYKLVKYYPFLKKYFSNIDLNILSKYFIKRCDRVEWKGRVDNNFLPTGKGCMYCISGTDVYGICGIMKNGKFIGNGKVKVALTDGTLFGYSTSFVYEKYNNPNEIRYAMREAHSRAVKIWNNHYSSKTKSNYSISNSSITIKNCSSNKCYIYSYGNYDGVVTWFYEDSHYRLSLTNRSGWGLYYPDDKELNTGKCGKTDAKNLDDAISKFVKCYYIGHY